MVGFKRNQNETTILLKTDVPSCPVESSLASHSKATQMSGAWARVWMVGDQPQIGKDATCAT